MLTSRRLCEQVSARSEETLSPNEEVLFLILIIVTPDTDLTTFDHSRTDSGNIANMSKGL